MWARIKFKASSSVSYELKLTNEFAMIHLVFNVYVLMNCIGDPLSILPLNGLGVKYIFLMKRSRLRSWTTEL